MPYDNTPNGSKAFINQVICKQSDIEDWFNSQWRNTPPPFYTSVDLRNAGFKLAPVDTNLFPAGFNNLNQEHMPLYIKAAQATIAESSPGATQLLVIPESHSRNQYYFESVAIFTEILEKAGFDTRIGSLSPEIKGKITFHLPSGRTIDIEPIQQKNNRLGVKGFFPNHIILNNDLSDTPDDLFKNTKQKIMPVPELGWYNRLKSEHFYTYEQVANEFSKLIDIDPWLINPLFDQCPEINFLKKEGESCLVDRAKTLLEKIAEKYKEHDIDKKPFLVIKADSGSYGMAVMTIQDSEELTHLNRKQRTRMSVSKGGISVTKAMLQEGVYTFETIKETHAVAEPVIYIMGRQVIGGFYRVHKNRGPNENLNAPGMNFIPLCFEESCNDPSHNPGTLRNRFYVYGVIGRLATLAAAREFAALDQQQHRKR